jgi:hypothetical protein
MGRNVAGGCHRTGWHHTAHSQERGSGHVKGVQNTAACRTRPGTATLGRQLTHLQTASHSYVLGVREEVANGRALSTQTLNSIGRQIPDPKALGPGARNHVHEGHLPRITSSVRRAQSHDSLGEIREEPDRFARGDVGFKQGQTVTRSSPPSRVSSCRIRISSTSDASRWTRCDWSSTARRSLTKRSIGSWRRPGSGVAKRAVCRRGTYCSMLEQSKSSRKFGTGRSKR